MWEETEFTEFFKEFNKHVFNFCSVASVSQMDLLVEQRCVRHHIIFKIMTQWYLNFIYFWESQVLLNAKANVLAKNDAGKTALDALQLYRKTYQADMDRSESAECLEIEHKLGQLVALAGGRYMQHPTENINISVILQIPSNFVIMSPLIVQSG